MSGAVFATTSNAIVTNTDLPWWAVLLIACVPTILGLITDLITTWLKNKGYISSETKDKIDSAVDDVIDSAVDSITKKEEDTDEQAEDTDKDTDSGDQG